METLTIVDTLSGRDAIRGRLAHHLSRRPDAALELADDAERVARACYAMAERFHRDGKLIVFGNGGAGTDAQHVAVEFVHPVIVGKRALPAISLTNDVATVTGVSDRSGFEQAFTHHMRHLGKSSAVDFAFVARSGDPLVV